MTEIEVRHLDFEARLENVETRQVTGMAVPYGQTINIGGFQERVERGAFDTSTSIPLLWGHNHSDIPIGRVISMRDTEEGLEIDAVLNDTDKGENVYRALKAGDVSKFSIGFTPTKSRKEGDVIVREKGTLREVSVVNFPAYSKASVTSVREADQKEMESKSMTVDNDYSAEIGELRDSIADLGRKFDKNAEAEVPAVQFRSASEVLKGLAKGDEAAKAVMTRDFGTMADADVTRPAFINAALKLVEKQRIVKSLFTSAPLPASGNSIEYPFVLSEAGTVGVQATEGTNLPYMELQFDTATAGVKTYGGYSSLSRQAIERSDLSYLETVLRYQLVQYGNATELAVQQALAAAAGANSIELGGATGSAKTAAQYLEAVIDAKAAIDDNSKGLTADVVLVSRDVHKKLSLLVDTTGRPVFALNGDGQNTFGTIPAGRLSGVIDGTPIVIGKNLAAGTIVVASADALISYESPGAPFRLQDENIINLTKDFSLYGYMAIAIPDVKGISRIVDAA